MVKEKTTPKGISFPGLLTIAFIVLKLTNHIDWDWLWVLSPICISISLDILLIVLEKCIKYFEKKANETE